MSSSFTLATLKTAIKNNVEDQGTGFADNLDQIIKAAEDRVLRALPLEIFKATASVTLTQGNPEVTKPTGYLACDTFFYTIAGTRYTILPRSYEYVIDYSPIATTEGLPKYYAELNTTTVIVGQSPNSSASSGGGTMRYLKRPNSVVTDTSGSWLSLNVGDLLLASCLWEADIFNVADERIPVRKDAFNEKLASAQFDFRHILSRSYTPMAAQPEAKGER